MAVDLNELLLGDQAQTLASAARAHVQSMDWHDRVTLKKFDEVDLLQAAAAKELGKAGLSTDLASLRPPALPTVPSQ